MDPENGAPSESELIRSDQEKAIHNMAEAADRLNRSDYTKNEQILEIYKFEAPSTRELEDGANKGEGFNLRLSMILPRKEGVYPGESVPVNLAFQEHNIQMMKEIIAAYEAVKQKK